MRKKLWWRIVLAVIPLVSVILAILVFSSAVDTMQEEVVVVKEPEYRSPYMPDSVYFAGERIPLGRFDVWESLDRELLSNAYFHSQTIRYIKLAPRYFAVIEPILREKGIPDDFKYLVVAESGFNPRAVSPASAVGLWQFLKGTAQDYGLVVNSEVDERYHVEKSTYAACDYLNDSFEKYGDWALVAATYNAGMNGVDRQIERQKTESYYDLLLGEETERYLFRVISFKLILEDPEKYHFYIEENEKYPIIETEDVEINGSVEDFADFAGAFGISYKMFKDFNPWLRENYLNNPNARKYVVKIPLLNDDSENGESRN